MIPRTPEPEVMDGDDQAAAYAAADFDEVNQAFVDRFVATFPDARSGHFIDLGCGPADITVRLCKARPAIEVTGVDASGPMLHHARQAADQAGLADRVELIHALLPADLPRQAYDAVISNSLLHHLPDPSVLWQSIADVARPGAPVLVTDLTRPETDDAARQLVEAYAAGEPEVLRRDFYLSLHAAFTPAEVRAQLETAGLAPLEVCTISDRHLAVTGRR